PSHGFVYDPSTAGFTDVTPGSGSPSIVQGINRFMRVAGTFVQPQPRRLFGLVSQFVPVTSGGAAKVVFADHFQLGDNVNGQLVFVGTRARGINDRGLTTGASNASNGGTSGFV